MENTSTSPGPAAPSIYERLTKYSGSPLAIILLWLGAIAMRFGAALITEDGIAGIGTVTLRLIGPAVFAALAAAAILGTRASTVRLLHAFVSIDFSAALIQLVLASLIGLEREDQFLTLIYPIVAMGAVVWNVFRSRVSRQRLAWTLFALAAIGALPFASDRIDWGYYQLVSKLRDPEPSYQAPYDYADQLWEAQGRLIDESFARLRPPVPGASNIHMLAMAPDGSQQLFSREARIALRTFAARHGDDMPGGILLSNAASDIMKVPLATRAVTEQVTHRIAKGMDPARDTLLIYLVSHGGEDAELVSSLPNYDWVQPISAPWLAKALDDAKIRRRVIIVSACYAGSWIGPLANDDSIIIAAAAADRTSFGCSDARRMTFFGEAFLEGQLARGASLADAFADAKRRVAKWEQDRKLTPSMPQALVGKNMREFWLAAPGSKIEAAR